MTYQNVELEFAKFLQKKLKKHLCKSGINIRNSYLCGLGDDGGVDNLKQIRSQLGKQRGEQLTAEKENRIMAIKNAINTGKFTKPSGTINQLKLSAFLGVHRNTIRNLIPFAIAEK